LVHQALCHPKNAYNCYYHEYDDDDDDDDDHDHDHDHDDDDDDDDDHDHDDDHILQEVLQGSKAQIRGKNGQ